jgi:hypothetical protein
MSKPWIAGRRRPKPLSVVVSDINVGSVHWNATLIIKFWFGVVEGTICSDYSGLLLCERSLG